MPQAELKPDPEQPARARRLAEGLRVALVHDWLLGMRGGEWVLEALLELFPRAEIYTLFYNPRGVSSTINRRPIFPSPLSSLPGIGRFYRAGLPFLPTAIETMRIADGYDLVISTSHCVAHGVRPPRGVPHLTYCFSPMRYLYDQQSAYADGGAGISTLALRTIAPYLQTWDVRAARRCGNYLAISDFVSRRIRKAYGLKAPVIYPPVRTDFFTPGSPNQDAESPISNLKSAISDLKSQILDSKLQIPDDDSRPHLIVSALTQYKRIDIAIEAANRLKRELVIAGAGPMERRLRKMAGPTVQFTGWVEGTALRELYRSCSALIFPGEEDFGIAPLEAMACGKPVLALRAGGLMETHIEGETGTFFDRCTSDSLAEVWDQFNPGVFNAAAIRRHAERFGIERFLDEFAVAVEEFLTTDGRCEDLAV